MLTRLLSRVIFAAALLIWGAFPVMAQNTRQQETQINAATFSNCNNQCINGLMVKAYNDGLNAAVGFLNDLNIWTSQNIYVLSPSLPGIGCVNANGPGQPVNYVACSGGGAGAVASVTGTAPIVASPTTGAVVLTCPTCGVTGSPLSQFATTSSAQLLATLSDETGTGVAVFNNTPTLITPNFSGTVTGDNTHPLSILFQGAANTMVGNWTGGTANFLAKAMPSCPDSGGSHLNYVSGTGITCGSSGSGGGVASIAGNTGAFTLGGLLINSTNLLQVVAASKADQQTPASGALAVTPLHQQDHDSALKASVNFVGATGVVNSSYGVTSVSRSGTGVYTVTFSTAFASIGGYGCVANTETTAAIIAFCVNIAASKTTTVELVDCFNGSTAAATDPAVVNLACYGRQ